jgi:hypothetical protein
MELSSGIVFTGGVSEDDFSVLYNGGLLSALEANGTNADTIIYILFDHSFGSSEPTKHGCSPHTLYH